MLLDLPQSQELMRRDLAGAEDALERCELILEQQHQSLRLHPPPALSDAVRLAATPRLRAGEPVIARARFPLERARVAWLFARLARGTVEDSGAYEDQADAFLGLALPRVLADDGRGLLDVPDRIGLAAPAALALLREALKPELLRVSEPFRALVEAEAPPSVPCPLCGSAPSVGTDDGSLLCRWCGLVHRAAVTGCAHCGGPVKVLDIGRIVRGGRLESCPRCTGVLFRFALPPDPLLLSLHAVMAAPVALAARLQSGAEPTSSFGVF